MSLMKLGESYCPKDIHPKKESIKFLTGFFCNPSEAATMWIASNLEALPQHLCRVASQLEFSCMCIYIVFPWLPVLQHLLLCLWIHVLCQSIKWPHVGSVLFQLRIMS